MTLHLDNYKAPPAIVTILEALSTRALWGNKNVLKQQRAEEIRLFTLNLWRMVIPAGLIHNCKL